MPGNTLTPLRPFRRRAVSVMALAGLGLYAAFGLSSLGFSGQQLLISVEHARFFFRHLLAPDFTQYSLLLAGVTESLQIAILGTACGILLALPLSLGAARLLLPRCIWWPARMLILLCSAIHPLITAFLLVIALGTNPLAGILALTLAVTGLLGKFWLQRIEAITRSQLQALRCGGASYLNIISYAVLPQLMLRFPCIAACQLSISLRHSVMIGVTGAGGIGGTLSSALHYFDFGLASATLIAIIVLMILGGTLLEHMNGYCMPPGPQTAA